MIEYFYQLNTTEDIKSSLMLNISSRSDWFESNGFQILKLPRDFFKDSALENLIKDFHGIPLIFKLDPMTWYDWHIDSTRTCAINMLISGDDSQCFYGDRVSRDIVKITELKYQPNRYYLLNTKSKHAVLNLENTRYMLSIGFEYPSNYEIILNFCKNNLL